MAERDPELTDAERTVLDVLADEHRVNPYLVHEETNLDEESAIDVLNSLTSAGRARKVTHELYEFISTTDDDVRGIPEIPNKENQTAPIEPDSTDKQADDS